MIASPASVRHFLNICMYAGAGDRNAVEGLIGNYDGKPNNDFILPDGSSGNVRQFNLGWR